jgi:hypothetical protein
VLAGQERRELELLDVGLEALDAARQLLREVGVRLLRQHLVEGLDVADTALEGLVPVDVLLEAGELAGDLLPPGRVVPQGRIGGLPLEIVQLRALALDVKGTPWRPRCARRGP